ncbi:dihydrofolate reductase [Spiroplasma syrphidicola EA-1]|uniref:Dihydrofolate reductase n=1 Tax=Spiroplasma syrphidicola EA-1 TaxID=1276229 RepID=R4U3I3_9MOLU|nr:dihydrofolate reductase [Spiroplasma syrphidicola]AGM25967.1 dihydrofolate reductase [Spiroplasma syrphidicola EA-1]
MIKLLWAMDENRLIGAGNKLPWHLKEELAHFKATTLGKTILFGRKTYEGIGKKLPDRKIFLLTHQEDYKIDDVDVEVINNFDNIIEKYSKNPTNEILICGGKKVYEDFLPYADMLIISEIKGHYVGDTYFPGFDITAFQQISEVVKPGFIIKEYIRKEEN